MPLFGSDYGEFRKIMGKKSDVTAYPTTDSDSMIVCLFCSYCLESDESEPVSHVVEDDDLPKHTPALQTPRVQIRLDHVSHVTLHSLVLH